MQLTPEQWRVANALYRIGRKRGEDPIEIRAAIATGLVESNLKNLTYGDADSQGWRQERASLYRNPTNLRASINRFYDETSAVQGQYGRAGSLAAAVQRPAAQYRGRYQERMGDAKAILGQLRARGGQVPVARASRGRGDGGGRVTSLSQVVRSPDMVVSPPPSQLMEMLSPERPSVPVSAPSPTGQGADRYLRGASSGVLPSVAPPVPQGQGGLSQQLAAIGDVPSLSVPGSSKTVTVSGVKPQLSTDNFGKRGGGGQPGRTKAVRWAESVVGKAEIAGSNRSPWIDKLQAQYGFKGAAWCAMFTSKAIEMGGLPRSSATAAVAQVRSWAHQKQNGYRGFVRSQNAKPGDLILWGNDHIGMVTANNGKGLTIIAGNDSNRVNKRRVSYGDGDIVRPDYRR